MRLLIPVLLLASCASSGGDAAQAYRDAEEAYRAGNLDRALERSEAAVRAAPDSPKPYLIRAKAFHGKGRAAEAEADFTRAVEKAPEESRSVYQFWRGLFYSDTGRHDKALVDFERACEGQMRRPVEGYYIECFRERAKARLALGRFDDAVKDCDFILGSNPDERTRKEFEELRARALRRGK